MSLKVEKPKFWSIFWPLNHLSGVWFGKPISLFTTATSPSTACVCVLIWLVLVVLWVCVWMCGVCVVSERCLRRVIPPETRPKSAGTPHKSQYNQTGRETKCTRAAFSYLGPSALSRRLEFITVMIINLKEERRDSSRVYCNKKWREALAVARRVRLFAHIISYFRRSRLWAGVFFPLFFSSDGSGAERY